MYTATKAVTLSASNAVFYEYLLTVRKWRDTSLNLAVLPMVEPSTLTAVSVSLVQKHSPPIAGTFRMFVGINQVGLLNGTSFSNFNLPYNL
jgi:hypothetical protein